MIPLRILITVCLMGHAALGAPQKPVQQPQQQPRTAQLGGSAPRPVAYSPAGPTSPSQKQGASAGPNFSQQLALSRVDDQATAQQQRDFRLRSPSNPFQGQQPIVISHGVPQGTPPGFPAFQSSTPFPLAGRQGIVPLRSPGLQQTTAADDEEYEDEEYEDEPSAQAPSPRPSPQPTGRPVIPVQRSPVIRLAQPQPNHFSQQGQPGPPRFIVPQAQPQPQQQQQQPQQQIQRRPVQQQQRPVGPSPTPQQLQSLQQQPNRQPQQRPSHNNGGGGRNRVSTPPPVQTINRFMKNNDDGSITWGYENEDGTFKEETLGADCVVRGKYGYVDPDGNKREYEYQSGNPCDPNKRGQEEEEEQELEQRQRLQGAGNPRPQQQLQQRRPQPQQLQLQ